MTRSTIGILSDAKHWHDRAEEARVVVNLLTDVECRKIYERIVEGYENMAKQAEARTMLR